MKDEIYVKGVGRMVWVEESTKPENDGTIIKPIDNITDAYEQAHQRDIAAGKARNIDYTKCLCGYRTHAIIHQTGQSWICDDPKCTKPSRFEKVEK